jgi:uncharacterized protein YdcH (DUF465 family)
VNEEFPVRFNGYGLVSGLDQSPAAKPWPGGAPWDNQRTGGTAVSVLLGESELRERLLSENEDYRRLAAEHQSYSERLEKLISRHHLTEEEKLEEIQLKKKKLMLKDQMYAMLQKYRKQVESGS